MRILDQISPNLYQVVDFLPAGSNNRNYPLSAGSYKIGAQDNGH